MSVFDGVEYCDKCHLVIAPKDPGRLNYGKVHYHASCYLARRRQNPRPAFVTALLLALLIVIANGAQAASLW